MWSYAVWSYAVWSYAVSFRAELCAQRLQRRSKLMNFMNFINDCELDSCKAIFTTMNFMNDDEANSWTTVIMNFMSSVIINSCKLMQTHAKPYDGVHEQ